VNAGDSVCVHSFRLERSSSPLPTSYFGLSRSNVGTDRPMSVPTDRLLSRLTDQPGKSSFPISRPTDQPTDRPGNRVSLFLGFPSSHPRSLEHERPSVDFGLSRSPILYKGGLCWASVASETCELCGLCNLWSLCITSVVWKLCHLTPSGRWVAVKP
jgi:hypothetical protein